MPAADPHPLPYLFDLDGTLIDSLPDIAGSANFTRRHYDLPELPIDAVRGMVGDGLVELLRRALPHLADAAAEFGKTGLGQQTGAAQFDAAVRIYRAHYQEHCTVLTKPYPGVAERLARWFDAGHPMAVVTNKPADFAQTILDQLGLARFFRVVIGGDSVAVRKPDPAPVWAALDGLQVERTRGIMVGDSPGDIVAGRSAGIRTAAALWGYRSEDELRAAGADEYWAAFGDGHP